MLSRNTLELLLSASQEKKMSWTFNLQAPVDNVPYSLLTFKSKTDTQWKWFKHSKKKNSFNLVTAAEKRTLATSYKCHYTLQPKQ